MRSIWKDSSRLKIVYWSGFFLIMTLYFYFSKEEGYRNSEKRTAVVIDKLDGYTRSGRFSERHYLYPQFQFEYNDSVYTSADNIVSAADMRIGDKLTVIFLANDPDDAVIYEFLSYWIDWIAFIVSFLIAVFLFVVICLLLLHQNCKRLQKINKKIPWHTRYHYSCSLTVMTGVI